MPSRDSVQDALQVLIDVQGPAWVVEPDIACCFEPDQKLRPAGAGVPRGGQTADQ